MSFFRREAETETPGALPRSHPSNAAAQAGGSPAGSTRDRAITRIADGTKIAGEVAGATELLVEGEVEGQIRVESRVVVGRGGVVRGQIEAREVLVAGTVTGDVRGLERVEVGGSGKLEGDIAAPRVTIAEGAFFKGKVEMGGADRERRGQPAPRAGSEPRAGAPPKEAAGSREPEERPGGLFPEGEGPRPGTGGTSSGGGRQ